MSGFGGPLKLPDWTRTNELFNPDANLLRHNQALASNYAPDEARIQTETGQQNLDDRGTLRGLIPGLATRDPTALATAAALPSVGGTSTASTLFTGDAQTAATKLNLLQYSAGLPQMPYGGGAGSIPLNSLFAPPGGSAAQPSGGSASPSADGAFLNQMGGSESGNNPRSVNAGGYSGRFQFGTGRLSDLSLYRPAQGEDPNGNHWQGTFNIPGFADVKTHQDFLNNTDAQRMAAEVHFKDIGQQIDNTPGAQDYDRNGLAAVAQLGGVHGMQKFVATGGQYNPHDTNGTSLSNYYQRFSQGGPAALKQAFGHPQGPLAADHPARQQVASAGNTAGMPPTATDATPMPLAGVGQAAPGSTTPAAPAAVQGLLDGYRGGQAQDGTQVNVDPSYLANRNTPVPGQGITSQQAVEQATQELGSSLSGMTPEAANAAVQQRALHLLGGGGIPSAPAAQPVASGPGQIIPPSQLAPPGVLVQHPDQPGTVTMTTAASPLAQGATPAQSQPRPIMPGSSVMTTQPFADQQFPPGQGVSAPTAAAPPVPAPAQPAQSSALPPGAQPIKTRMGLPYTAGAPAGFGWAQMPDTSLVPYPLVAPALKIEKTPTEILGLDPRTGAVVNRTPIAETGRMVFRDVPGGSQGYLNGHPVGEVVPFSGRPEQNEAYKADQKQASALASAAQTAQSNMPRLNEMATLAQGLATGPLGDFKAKAQAYLESAGVAPESAARLTGMSSAAAAQEFIKLGITAAGSASKADVGANNGIESVRLYQNANPNLALVPDANKRITNMMRVASQATQDYAQAALQHFGDNESKFLAGGNYAPLTTFNRTWQTQANPQVYAAATGILNGDAYSQWAQKLSSPADAKRAAAIAARVDPNATVPIAGGHTRPARELAQ